MRKFLKNFVLPSAYLLLLCRCNSLDSFFSENPESVAGIAEQDSWRESDLTPISFSNFLPPQSSLSLALMEVSGMWSVSFESDICRFVTSQTPVLGGYHARPLGCSYPLSSISYWKLDGKILSFYDRKKRCLALLYSDQKNYLKGITLDNKTITLTR